MLYLAVILVDVKNAKKNKSRPTRAMRQDQRQTMKNLNLKKTLIIIALADIRSAQTFVLYFKSIFMPILDDDFCVVIKKAQK